MRIIVGITGGIAAYKVVSLIRLLDEQGHQVKVVPTANALRFVGKTTLEAISHNLVDENLYSDVAEVKHVALGQNADLVIVAPATASFLARTAAGLADDLLSNVILATKAPVVLAPAMHTEMWFNQATVANVSTLRQRGIHVIEPAIGRLTGDDTGAGRLPDVDVIAAESLAQVGIKPLKGKKVVVTAGGTREFIDPVRFIGNSSSGKQGTAFADEAFLLGADVTLIAANFAAQKPYSVIAVTNTNELEKELASACVNSDVLIMSAAVSDYRTEQTAENKIKKNDSGDKLTLTLTKTPDLLSKISKTMHERPGSVVVGFAAETISNANELVQSAMAKLATKGCDFIVANDVSEGKVFGSEFNRIHLISDDGKVSDMSGTKSEVARFVLHSLLPRLNFENGL